MNPKSLIITLLMVALVSLAALADIHHEVTTKVTHFDYSDYTYTYIDENGVEQTASLIDEATNTDQIIALLKKIYTDPTIPGIHYAYDYKDAEGQPYQRKKLNYNANASRGTPWGSASGIVNPYEDGMTMLVVTHEKELVNAFSKRVVALEGGMLTSDGMNGYYGYEN